jgi:hypothetical protein
VAGPTSAESELEDRIKKEKNMQAITRRSFGTLWGTCLLALSIGPSLLLSGCGTTFAAILSWIDTGLSAFASVVDLLVGQGVLMVPVGSAIDLLIKAIKAAIADIGTAVSNYNAAPAASKTTLEGKISTALVVAQNLIAQFWNDLSIPDTKLASTVAGLLGLIVSTLAGFMSLLPPAPAPVAITPVQKALPVSTQRLTTAQFKVKFNAILAANGFSNYARF